MNWIRKNIVIMIVVSAAVIVFLVALSSNSTPEALAKTYVKEYEQHYGVEVRVEKILYKEVPKTAYIYLEYNRYKSVGWTRCATITLRKTGGKWKEYTPQNAWEWAP